jgi:hypothetical protein
MQKEVAWTSELHNMKRQTFLVDVFTDGGSPKVSETGEPFSPPDCLRLKDQLVQQQDQRPPTTDSPPAAAPLLTPVPVGQRIFCDPEINLERGQSWYGEAFALLTMGVYMSVPHILIMLVAASFFSRTALYICIGELTTAPVRLFTRADPSSQLPGSYLYSRISDRAP